MCFLPVCLADPTLRSSYGTTYRSATSDGAPVSCSQQPTAPVPGLGYPLARRRQQRALRTPVLIGSHAPTIGPPRPHSRDALRWKSTRDEYHTTEAEDPQRPQRRCCKTRPLCATWAPQTDEPTHPSERNAACPNYQTESPELRSPHIHGQLGAVLRNPSALPDAPSRMPIRIPPCHALRGKREQRASQQTQPSRR